MHPLTTCLASLRSYTNLHRAVVHRVRYLPHPARELQEAVALRGYSINLRLRQPHRWQLDEIQAIADYYQLPNTVCKLASDSLTRFHDHVMAMDTYPRNQLLKSCQLTEIKLAVRMRQGWTQSHIDGVVSGVNAWLSQ